MVARQFQLLSKATRLSTLFLLLSTQVAIAQFTLPFNSPPANPSQAAFPSSTQGIILSSSTDSSGTSYTTVIEEISCPSLGASWFTQSIITVTNTTVYTTTTCPCFQLTTLVTLASPPASPTPPPPSPTSNLPYANSADFSPYMPCVPRKFLCTDANTFWTCDITVTASWTWQYPRQVAAGMECVPSLSPGIGQGQMPGAPAGYYRSDQYDRAGSSYIVGGGGGQPPPPPPPNSGGSSSGPGTGAGSNSASCSPDGSIECTGSGYTWAMCDHGAWTNMGSVAPGTICVNGDFLVVD